MKYLEQAIKDAVEEGGWKPKWPRCVPLEHFKLRQVNPSSFTFGVPKHHGSWTLANEHKIIIEMAVVFLDPTFWQALGKARGWRKDWPTEGSPDWLFHWHRFIDHLAEGKDAESFFESLLNNH